MTVIAALSLFVGVSGLVGSSAVISDGLGMSRVGTVTGAPYLGSSGAPPPAERQVNTQVVAFGAVRLLLSVSLVAGAIGTLWVRRYGRRASLAFAIGWIALGIVEPFALGYRFGWPVVVSALYPFLLLMVFNSPAWRTAFAGTPAAPAKAGPA
jgi:hypothetical protein